MNFYDAALVTDHMVRLSGLSPSTKYYYAVEDQYYVLQGDQNNHFFTAPLTGDTQPVRIWAIGDFGDAGTGQAAVRDSYINYTGTTYTNLWLWLGDNAYSNGTEAEYQAKVFSIYPTLFKNIPLYPSIGNHDYAQSGYQSSASLTTNFPYFRIVSVPTAAEAGGVPSLTEKYYSYDYGNIHFIALDSYGSLNAAGSPMYNWLVNDLDANQQRWTIVYFHHPPYTKGSHDSDTDPELANMRTRIIPVLESHHVDLVLSGHSHANERTALIQGHYGLANTFGSSMIVQGGSGTRPTPYIKSPPYAGTVYAVCGTGGELSSTTQPGWPMPCMVFSDHAHNASLVIDVAGDRLDCKYLSATEGVLDEFTILKTSSPRFSAEVSKTSFRVEPNPFANEALISYSLTEKAMVSLDIYDLLGSKVYSFTNKEQQQQGSYEFMLSPSACKLSPGIYAVTLTEGKNTFVRKVIFAK
jgi:predicted MPP superfamily phosphohydrolase